MPNKPKKPQNTIEETEDLAGQIREIADKVQWYADEMRKRNLPTFGYFKETVQNKYIYELKMWLAQLNAEWQRQELVFEKSKRDAARDLAGKPRRGRPPKKRF